MFQAQVARLSGTTISAWVQLDWFDHNGAWMAGSASANCTSNSSAAPSTLAATALMPAGACYVRATIAINGGVSGNVTGFNNFYMRRCSDASVIIDGTLQALFARIAGALYSTNYTAGSAGNAPVGFKLSSTNFSATDVLGNVFNALMEIGGAINLGGYQLGQLGVARLFYGNAGNNAQFFHSSRNLISVTAANTFHRSSGSFLDDGVTANQPISFVGFANANNNGGFWIASVTATDIVITSSPLTVEAAGSGWMSSYGWSWTAPQIGAPGTVYQVRVTVQGGGGGGGTFLTGQPLYGGAAGGTAIMTLNVTGGTVLSGNVGNGGYSTAASGFCIAGGTSTLNIGGTNVSGWGSGLLITAYSSLASYAAGAVTNGSGGSVTGVCVGVTGASIPSQANTVPGVNFWLVGGATGANNGGSTGGTSNGMPGGASYTNGYGGGASPFGAGGAGSTTATGAGSSPAATAYGAGGGSGGTTSGQGARGGSGYINIQIL
jgi:hypothetical protein